MVQHNLQLLKAKVLDGKAESMLLCAMEGVGMRALEEIKQIELIMQHVGVPCSCPRQKLMAQRSEFVCGQDAREKLSGTNTKQHLPPWSWCMCCVEGNVSGQLNRSCISDRDVSDIRLLHHEQQEFPTA